MPKTYPVEVGDGHKRGAFLLLLGCSAGSLLFFEEETQQRHGGLLEQAHHRLVQRVLVLLQPACNVVTHLQEVVAQMLNYILLHWL